MKKAKVILILILITSLVFLNGCWDAKEFERHTLIKGIGIDIADDKDRIKLTIQYITPSEKIEESQSSSTYTTSATGYSIYEANRNLIKQVGRKPYYGHSQIIILGEEIARKGIAPFLDYLLREKQIRPRSRLAIARGQAENILQKQHILEPVSASGIESIIDGISVTGTIVTTNLIESVISLLNDYRDPVISTMELRKGGLPEENGSSKGKKDVNLIFSNGGVMLKGDVLADWLTRKETRGYNWVRHPEEIRGPVILRLGKDGLNARIGIEITHTEVNVIPRLIDGKFSIKIHIITDGAITENTSKTEDITKLSTIDTLNKRFAQVIKNEILNALDKSRQYEADIFGFGDIIYKKYPREFNEVKDKWDQIYTRLPVKFDIRANIRREGMIKKGLGTISK